MTFACDGGIPALFPSAFDAAHLHEEQNLAEMMKEKETDAAVEFELGQWRQSKQEFWAVVNSAINDAPKQVINIGCGYDHHFSELASRGHVFVNFDIVLKMLKALQSEFGARFCVNGDINRLPFKPRTFDYVVSIDVIHHECDRLPAVLASFRDLLKPGGTLFLEDPNAWGMFQFTKSILLPRPVYQYARSAYHRLRQSTHRPAEYEFPTNVWRVMDMLRELGFDKIKSYPHTAYPTIGRRSYKLYRMFSGSSYVRTFHNYHYMLSAVRSGAV
jgi:SAM-dependent methyltransferase